ncbi:tRNA (adenine(22)-N(1))-methyltransferase [Streptococcus loxodontisalivarius]|uniref:tRNA (Adenine22-N1)-methyltransferase n=1 Tax=Streptococcus loxodontisalivarius TaxID=1349415 RepID=A0ABS2PRH6_9STRE|nr:tRNA (adenine(22)-N(1))-methyltransferase TrmK [Streptococcus loxodontisalivarius]MBM7642648.1 tRNA (adenine22-N1)-methyltransferase [Streptococcus loxodontisalivarius]
METVLSQRLRQVAAYVPQGAKLLDVGSDHAYLPIALLEEGKISSAIAGEVVKGPFESAQKNVAASGFEEKIEVRLANGLAAFEPSDQVTAISICGMGGRLIADILEAGKEKLTSVDRLILQPNNREDDLRRWLVANGFAIIAEEIMTENGKFYEILVAEAGQAELTADQERFGPFLMTDLSDIFRLKWEREWNKLDIALAQVPLSNEESRSALIQKMEKIKEVLANES